jgi:hypothetical protein
MAECMLCGSATDVRTFTLTDAVRAVVKATYPGVNPDEEWARHGICEPCLARPWHTVKEDIATALGCVMVEVIEDALERKQIH